jgi:hypothetical protein
LLFEKEKLDLLTLKKHSIIFDSVKEGRAYVKGEFAQ